MAQSISDRTRPPRIVFHIGLERTGTTSLQYFCFENRRVLSDNSIFYPTRNLGFRGVNHVDLVASYLPLDPQDYFLRGRLAEKRRIVDSLKREIEASRAQTILVSAEHFSSRFRRSQIEELAADFRNFDCKIVVFLRDHVSRFYSAYASHVASGGHKTLEDYAEEILHPDNMYFRYADTIFPWEEAFGRPNIEVRKYVPGCDVLVEFFGAHCPTPLCPDVLAATQKARIDLVARRSNRSLGPRRIEWLRAANARISAMRGPSSETERIARHHLWVAIRSFLHLTASAGRLLGLNQSASLSLDAARRDSLIAIARADEARLKERYGVSLGH